jgi:hypothetical protein
MIRGRQIGVVQVFVLANDFASMAPPRVLDADILEDVENRALLGPTRVIASGRGYECSAEGGWVFVGVCGGWGLLRWGRSR